MRKRFASRFGYACVIGSLMLGASAMVAAQEKDKGESREFVALKNRRVVPKGSDIDRTVNLDGLLSKKDADGWSTSKAAVVEGYVIQLEREEDGDQHLVLAGNDGETDTTKWVICEVTPAWSRKSASLSAASLKKLRGKKVRVTGWLYYEPDAEATDPRGTRWELHPVTAITVLK